MNSVSLEEGVEERKKERMGSRKGRGEEGVGGKSGEGHDGDSTRGATGAERGGGGNKAKNHETPGPGKEGETGELSRLSLFHV